MSNRGKLWSVVACGLVLAQAVASLLLPRSFALIAISDIAQCILLLFGTLALFSNVFATQGRARLFWALMSLGLAFWFSYQMLWTYFEVYQRTDVPNPFVGDVVLFLHIVPMMAALALQPDVQQDQDQRRTRLGSLDFALLLVWWLFLYVYAVIPWQYAHTSATVYEHNLNIVYLTEKTVFLAGLAALWARSSNGWKTIYAHLFGAGITYALSSYVANWGIEHGVYFSGSLYDVPLAASMAWITGIGMLALHLSPKEQIAQKSRGHGVWVARLGMIAIFSLPLFAAWSLFDTAPARVRIFRLVTTLGCMMVMGAMVFLKQHMLDRELLRLLRSSEQSFEDLRRLQAQLVQSEKLASLGQLVGGAAHELNNPLTAMLGYSDLLTSTQLNGEQRALADKIGVQVRRTKSLVSSLLSFAKQAPVQKTLIDINVIARTALKMCEPQLTAQSIEVQTTLDPELPPVQGDSNQLLQVCLHIINNAVQAMQQEGGRISVTTARNDGHVLLEFSDNGRERWNQNAFSILSTPRDP